jgi:hypothetical protein
MTLVRVEITLCVLKSHSAYKNHTQACQNDTHTCENHSLPCQNDTHTCENHSLPCQNDTHTCENHTLRAEITRKRVIFTFV